jgi:hypothetical protein
VEGDVIDLELYMLIISMTLEMPTSRDAEL